MKDFYKKNESLSVLSGLSGFSVIIYRMKMVCKESPIPLRRRNRISKRMRCKESVKHRLFFVEEDMAKEWSKPFYNSAAWKHQRAAVLKRDRYRCTEPGCHRTAEEVHHIIELTEQNISDTKISLDMENLRSLCGDCHKRITKQMNRKACEILEDIIFDENGYPVSANIPPGGGGEK